MREINKFTENLKRTYNFSDVKWLGCSLQYGHKFDISLCEQHIGIFNSKIKLFRHYELQAKISAVERYKIPISQIQDIHYDLYRNHLIIEGNINIIKEFLFYVFDKQN